MNYHFHLFTEEWFPIGLMADGNIVDFILGISSINVADIPHIFFELNKTFQRQLMEMKSWMSKVQCLMFSSIYELDKQVIDVLKAKFDFPIYSVGLPIPYFELKSKTSLISDHQDFDYIKWLDMQPASSIWYISMGIFLSVSIAQIDEIVAGVKNSGIRYLLVACGEASRLKDNGDDLGMLVPSCDQLRVLCHSLVGGFLTHCRWNSCVESGVPVLTFPIFIDQVPNSKQLVNDWKVG